MADSTITALIGVAGSIVVAFLSHWLALKRGEGRTIATPTNDVRNKPIPAKRRLKRFLFFAILSLMFWVPAYLFLEGTDMPSNHAIGYAEFFGVIVPMWILTLCAIYQLVSLILVSLWRSLW
jgi:magnesium-transporting ATPase (P-type)